MSAAADRANCGTSRSPQAIYTLYAGIRKPCTRADHGPTSAKGPVGASAQPLTRMMRVPIHCRVSRLDGRSGNHRKVAGEESPGSMDIRCRITTGGREPRESATESRPPPSTHPLSPLAGEGQGGERQG